MGVINLEGWLASRREKRRLKAFSDIEKHLRLARVGMRKVRVQSAVKSNLHMVQDTSRLLVDLQIYKRDVGVLQDEHLRREINRVRGYANTSSILPY